MRRQGNCHRRRVTLSAPDTTPLSLTYLVVPFEPLQESWNVYSFSDGIIIRFRLILTRVTTLRRTLAAPYQMSFQHICLVEAPASSRGQPTTKAQSGINEEKYETKPFDTIEDWNSYRIRATDDILKVKFVASAFYRIRDRFDQFGEPMHSVDGTPMIVSQSKTRKQA
jgi:hypothetical protein